MLKTIAALAAGVLAAGVLAPPPVRAEEPAAQTVDRLDAALLESMKAGKSQNADQRFRQLQPVVNRAFNLKAMIRVAVGPASFDRMSPADQAALTAAFGRFTAASYAHSFDSYSGQKFSVDTVDTRLPDKLVHTQLQSPGSSVVLVYRLRQADGGWKIIDVFFNGSISSLARSAADFSSTVAAGGAPALVRKLNTQSDQLLK